MYVRADQLRVGDQLRAGEVAWVLPSLDRTHLVIGLRNRSRKPGGNAHPLAKRFRPGDSVEIISSGRD
jgi:hypothetical protein